MAVEGVNLEGLTDCKAYTRRRMVGTTRCGFVYMSDSKVSCSINLANHGMEHLFLFIQSSQINQWVSISATGSSWPRTEGRIYPELLALFDPPSKHMPLNSQTQM